MLDLPSPGGNKEHVKAYHVAPVLRPLKQKELRRPPESLQSLPGKGDIQLRSERPWPPLNFDEDKRPGAFTYNIDLSSRSPEVLFENDVPLPEEVGRG